MLKLQLYDSEKNCLFDDKTSKLIIPEAFIVEKSDEWFHEPNPRFIRRNSVVKRLYNELEDELSTYGFKCIRRDSVTRNVEHILGHYDTFDVIEVKG